MSTELLRHRGHGEFGVGDDVPGAPNLATLLLTPGRAEESMLKRSTPCP